MTIYMHGKAAFFTVASVSIFRVRLQTHRASLEIMVSRDGAATLKTCADVYLEIALKVWLVTFCPPFNTPYLILSVMLIRTLSKSVDAIIY